MGGELIVWPQVILFGDSITQFNYGNDGCWGALLADQLVRKCDVVNRGFSGYNTRWNKVILPRIIQKENASNIAVFVLFLGANDSNKAELNPMQHVPLTEFKENIIKMLEYLGSVGVGKEKIIIVSPPASDESAWEVECIKKDRPQTKCNLMAGEYAEGCEEVAAKCGVTCVQLYKAMMKRPDWRNMLNDGLHLSREGSIFLHSMLEPLIEECTSKLPYILPGWASVDNTNPQASLLGSPYHEQI
ncbi:unnamed protein product [Owenia fusiformis]|uniref:Isoamyl acetate-hydrolyzing esterase 1 homolog n=1 Tax=Owenia fusiformis TaxID=6347 RepID=A0A8S4N2R4_OWEFU|nr:unnamed protein product [Owenia fusiformis]CAH1774790.1 unnamed protein product [Owenia fusiformis]